MPGQRLAHDAPRVLAEALRESRSRRTRPPRAGARRRCASNSGPRRPARCLRSDAAGADGIAARPARASAGSGRAALVPRRRAARLFPPVDDASSNASFTSGDGLARRRRGARTFVSLSVKSSAARPRSVEPIRPAIVRMLEPHWPRAGRRLRRARRGCCASCSQAQVFRNHKVGSRWSGAGSGPRLATVTRIRMSFGLAFAYSTTTSK